MQKQASLTVTSTVPEAAFSDEHRMYFEIDVELALALDDDVEIAARAFELSQSAEIVEISRHRENSYGGPTTYTLDVSVTFESELDESTWEGLHAARKLHSAAIERLRLARTSRTHQYLNSTDAAVVRLSPQALRKIQEHKAHVERLTNEIALFDLNFENDEPVAFL